ncbi:magnesium chelatase subunit H [Phreatobacter oligotrophus]|uniref:magnesium chelatase n=1 Tax=Phreatobacter oligotrophus TaxID=1122261 RepID=A0A2T4Z2L4_9HYPH|nr:magnesium chelatase subunit H [Phreatobacter oligotrophus]PTM54998.1 cobaltochelatase CobN subunit [Phreatobacter oligotrophus]
MRKPISAADATPIRVAIVTLDNHLAGVVARARVRMAASLPGLDLSLHAASEWASDEGALARCRSAIDNADIILCSMLFMEEHVAPIIDNLRARRETCDAIVGCMSIPDVVNLTRLGRYRFGEKSGGALSFLKRLRGKSSPGGGSGAGQMRMLRRLPKILRFIPGSAQDLRAYFLVLQYWLAGSDDNVENMIRLLIDRYADGPRKGLRGKVPAAAPIDYPDVGLYHPRLPERITETASRLPASGGARVGLIVLRSYLLASDTRHYDGVIAALEARGLTVVPAFASGLDSRPAIERFFLDHGRPTVDAVISLTGFSLVGGPAYNDSAAAEATLVQLGVPYIAAHPLEFQTLEEWGASGRGLLPVENTIMVAIPEIDGAIQPTVFGGRAAGAGEPCTGCEKLCRFPANRDGREMQACPERAATLAARVDRLIGLRRRARAERKVGIVLFNFPPNAGNTGTAAYLAVFESLFNTLTAMAAAGYSVEVPEDVDALRHRILDGNAARYGTTANVAHRIPAADHVRREPHLAEIEAQWGPAPGRQQSDGAGLFVLGERFGNVFVGIQPAFGWEGDPMRLLFEKSFAPTHAFSAFYRYLREDFGADAVLHFGTHGALEFMPGKQAGLSARSWPDRLIGDLPNFYLYAANNPSEGALAKRRSAATLVSYRTPALTQAGLYRGLLDLKASIDRWRLCDPVDVGSRKALAELIQAQASAVELCPASPAFAGNLDVIIAKLAADVLELEYALIPHGLHVVGRAAGTEERLDLLTGIGEASHGFTPDRETLAAIVGGESVERALASHRIATDDATREAWTQLAATDRLLAAETEIGGILAALDGTFIRPAPGGDVLKTTAVLPTGRNLHGFDPFRIPSAFAVRDGAAQAERILARHAADGHGVPETIALVLWGTDNLKTEGGPIAQALALMGARPRFDAYGRLAGAELIPAAELGRPRIDVVMTLSGIFRDLLPLQIKLLADAAHLAAAADEAPEANFIRKHALAWQAEHGGTLDEASLRVFSNADGAYGANVNGLIQSGRWSDEEEIAETFARRKCFAYDRGGKPAKAGELLESVLAGVDFAYQNLDSVELGVTTVDQYFDTLGGITQAVKRARGAVVPVYISDQTRRSGVVRTLGEQVALETRTRTLNPKWYEGMLQHGYEGVRIIEEHVTNTVGWSATTGAVAPWIYKDIADLYVLDPAMRDRLASLNTTASARLANRLIEAHERNFWTPDPETLAALRAAGEDLEDRLEGVSPGRAA